MNTDSGRTKSVWMTTTAETGELAALASDIECDVCIVGAGIAGITTAYIASQQGRKVVVLDDGPVGGGETGRTTAHLVNALDDRFYELERLHGEEGSRLAAESHSAAIDFIERTVAQEKIDCDFLRLDGYLFLAPGEKLEHINWELEAAHRAGLTGVERVERAPIEHLHTGLALRFPNQGQFHPLKYLMALADAIRRSGGEIFTGSHAKEFNGGENASVVTEDGKTVGCKHIVVCTNTPVNDWVVMHTKQMPYRTYVIGCRISKGSVPRILIWDNEDPYHYIRIQEMPDRDVLIVGGEDHKTGQADDFDERFARLEEWTRQRWPMAQEVEFRWSGQVMEPVDALAYIGRNPGDEQNVYIATGDSGNGMTHGTIAGMLINDLISGRENAWAKLYDPSRKTLRAAGEFTKENLNIAVQYRDWVTPGEVKSVDEIPNDTGATVRRGLHKIAAYRDAQGKLHECSATCTHLGCIVNWNSKEKSWDCPCHGSRFDPYGRVINGPAVFDLAKIDEKQRESSKGEARPGAAADESDWRRQEKKAAERKPIKGADV